MRIFQQALRSEPVENSLVTHQLGEYLFLPKTANNAVHKKNNAQK